MSGSFFPVGLGTLRATHHVIAEPSNASWILAFSSHRLSGACCSQCEVARNAELQGLMGHLHAPRSYDIPTVSFHGARSRENSHDKPHTAAAARDRHWDGHWRGDCPSRPSRDRHSLDSGRNGWRCPPDGGAPAWARCVV